jgi:hypothetical protein
VARTAGRLGAGQWFVDVSVYPGIWCIAGALTGKRAEWEDYRRQVTEYERRRYLAIL